jgi:CubicO group peptidase (beta-lactamase class C family)
MTVGMTIAQIERRPAIAAAVLVLIVLAFSSSPAQEERAALLRQKMDSLLVYEKDANGPGESILVQKDDSVLYRHSFGLADLKTGEKFTERTVANLGSISKTFVAYGILKLRDAGQLSLDDPIIKYFPDFRNKEIANKVRIKNLLTHTSGLPDLRPVDRDSVFYLTANDEQNFDPLKSTDTLEFEPGSSWNYSNPSFNGLALIIQQVSGMQWQHYVAENIFSPSGMRQSKITDGAYPTEGVAHGYRMAKGAWEEYDYGEYPTFDAAGNGGVWSSIEELGKYYRAMRAASFIADSTIRRSQSLWKPANWSGKIYGDTSNVAHPPLNGFSWFVIEKGAPPEHLNYKVVFHRGEQAGFSAEFAMIPEKNILILIESNGLALEKGYPSFGYLYWAEIVKYLQQSGYL